MEAIVFGAFVKERRVMQGLTQAELAARLHVTAKAVSRWERGVGFPDINTLEPLAAALDVSLLELMQSRVLPDEAVSNEDASAAVADALSFAGAKKLGWLLKWIEAGSVILMIAAEFFLLAIIWKFVTDSWMRGASLVALWLAIALTGFLHVLRRAMESPQLPTRRQVLRWTLTGLGSLLFLGGMFAREVTSKSIGHLMQITGLGLLCVRDWWKVTKKN